MSKRGRPAGPTKAMSQYLDKVAEQAVRDGRQSINSIIVRVHGTEKVEEDLENFRRKMWRWWTRTGEDRLRAARERREDTRAPRIESGREIAARFAAMQAEMAPMHAILAEAGKRMAEYHAQLSPSLAQFAEAGRVMAEYRKHIGPNLEQLAAVREQISGVAEIGRAMREAVEAQRLLREIFHDTKALDQMVKQVDPAIGALRQLGLK